MQFNPPVKWMTEEELLALPMPDSFMSIRGPYPKRLVDFNEESDMWWYAEKHNDSKISWYRVIIIGKANDRSFDNSGNQES